jgi:septal ring factor EnvC (AmiA/AmiB activator)
MTTPTNNDLSPLAVAMTEARALLAELRVELAASREQRAAQEQLTKEAARLSASLTPMAKPSTTSSPTSGWTREQGAPD